MSSIFDSMWMEKVANPAAPVKSSKDGMERDEGPGAAYLNMGGGKAGKHTAGPVESKPQPWPGHVNIGDKSPGKQVAGDVDNRSGAPDTGERGTTMSDDNNPLTKSASWLAGFADSMEMVKEALALTDEGHKLQAQYARARRDAHSSARGAEDEYAKKAPVRASMRGTMGAAHRIQERRQDYKARKHEKGQNPLNPFGGLLTKSRSEGKGKK